MNRSANRTKLIFGVLTALFLLLSLLAHLALRFPGDLQATLLFQSIHSTSLLAVMEGVSYITGEWRAALIVITGGIVVWLRVGRLEASLVVLSGLITIVNEALKIAVNRPRPSADLVSIFVNETGGSFPSGHAFFAVLVLGMLTYLAVTHQTRPGLKAFTISVCLILIPWIGISRIYLGVHWVSDVIGGYVIGMLFLLGLIRLHGALSHGNRTRSP